MAQGDRRVSDSSVLDFSRLSGEQSANVRVTNISARSVSAHRSAYRLAVMICSGRTHSSLVMIWAITHYSISAKSLYW